MIYAQRSTGGEHGSVSTRREIVEFMLDLCGYVASKNLFGIRVLDPCAGDGIFVMAAIQRLSESSLRFGFDLQKAVCNLTAVEIDENKSHRLADRISGMAVMGHGGFTGRDVIVGGDFLTMDLPAFDIVIGNPPYVRHENIPDAKKAHYRNLFRCFRHRSDIYVAFFEKALECLSGTGQLCFICPDRWLKNRYGGNLRDRLSEKNGIPVIVNLNEIDAFEEYVSSYPMIILANTNVTLGNIEYFDVNDLSQLKSIVPWPTGVDNRKKPLGKKIPKPKHGELWVLERNDSATPGDFSSIEEQGFKIGIGIATGADSVFIGKDLVGIIEDERLMPVVLSRNITEGRIEWSENYLLNPFEDDGTLIDLDMYPATERYLTANKERLRKRHIARKNPEKNWYRTIDSIRLGLEHEPKLLLPDLKKNRLIAMDDGIYYPHHNLYHITGGSVTDLKTLGAVLMSDISLNQLSAVGIHMRGGYVRWQAQSLRRIMVPKIQAMPNDTKVRLARLFNRKDVAEINTILGEIARSEPHITQTLP